MTAAPTSAGAATLYAYAVGGGASPTSCPDTAATSQQCTLAEALSLAKAGATVALAIPGRTGRYVGNWSASISATSSSAPLTIKPAPGASGPILDGNLVQDNFVNEPAPGRQQNDLKIVSGLKYKF